LARPETAPGAFTLLLGDGGHQCRVGLQVAVDLKVRRPRADKRERALDLVDAGVLRAAVSRE